MHSTVIAAHNEGLHLQKTVQSLLENTGGIPFEIIIIDDASTDNSTAFCKSRPSAPLRLISFKKRLGCARARHAGVLESQGEFITILDGHCALPPNWAQSLIESLLRLSPRSAVTPALGSLDSESWQYTPAGRECLSIDAKFDFCWEPPRANFMLSALPGCGTTLKRSTYTELGGIDCGLERWGAENIDLSLKIYRRGGYCYLEPNVCIGHLFRSTFPYEMDCRRLVYNKLRVAFQHLPSAVFKTFKRGLEPLPGFDEAIKFFNPTVAKLEQRRQALLLTEQRDSLWYSRTFLPQLLP